MNNSKNYLKKLIKSPSFITSVFASIILMLLVYFCDGYNLFNRLIYMNSPYKFLIVAFILVAFIIFIFASLKGIKCKKLCFSDNILTFLLVCSLFGIVYTILTSSSLLLFKIVVILFLLAFTLALMIIRSKNFNDDSEIQSTYEHIALATYYKKLFKKYHILIGLFAICSIALIIIADKTSVIMQFLTNQNLAPIIFTGILVFGLLFVILLRSRVYNKEINSVDVMSLVGIISSFALIFIGFTLKGQAFVLSLLFGVFSLIVFTMFTSILVSHTHFNTKNEKAKLKDCDLKSYYSMFNHKSCILALITISLLFVAAILLVDTSDFLTVLLKEFETINLKYCKIFALFTIGLIFLIMCVDIFTRKVGMVDNFLFVIEISSLILTLVYFFVFKIDFYPRILIVLVALILSTFATYVRVKMVKIEEQEYEIPCEKEEVITQTEKKDSCDNEIVATETCEVQENQTIEVNEPITEVKLKRVNVKKSFETYLRTGDEQLKENYSQIENAFLSYGVHSRMTNSRENLSKKGVSMSKVKPDKELRLQAKILIRGKFIKLYLNLDPTKLDKKYFRHEDVSKKMPDQATYIKVRSKLTLKRALELIDMLASQEGFKKKKKFEPVDYVSMYGDEHLTYMQKLGYDYLIKDSITKEEVAIYKEEFAEKVVKTEIIPNPERYIYDEISLKELEDNFGDGGVATLEALRIKGLIKINTNYLTVKCSDKLSKKLYVEANAFDKHVIEMIFLAGGEATRLIGK